jgi:hypothetical protein
MKHIPALSCLLPGFCLLLACKLDAPTRPAIEAGEASAATAPEPPPAKPSYYDEKGVPSGTLLYGVPPDGSGNASTDIFRAITLNSASVQYSTDIATAPIDSIYTSFFFSNHVNKPLKSLEFRVSIFDETGKLLTKRIIDTDEQTSFKPQRGRLKYGFTPGSDGAFIMSASYFSDLSFAANPLLITIGDPLPVREFDEIALCIRKNGIKVRVEPLRYTFEDGTILTGAR